MNRLRAWWCRLMHPHSRLEYAGGRTYTCRNCGCTFPAPWADTRGREGRVTWTVDGRAA